MNAVRDPYYAPGAIVAIGPAYNSATRRRDIVDEFTGCEAEIVSENEDGSIDVEIEGRGLVNFASHVRFTPAPLDPAPADIFRAQAEERLRELAAHADRPGDDDGIEAYIAETQAECRGRLRGAGGV